MAESSGERLLRIIDRMGFDDELKSVLRKGLSRLSEEEANSMADDLENVFNSLPDVLKTLREIESDEI